MYTKEQLERKIKRVSEKIKYLKDKHGPNPSQNYTYHGGWDLGYFEGQLSVLEDLLLMEEEKKKDTTVSSS